MLEVVLGIDNLIFIAILADRLPERCIHQFATLDVLPWVRAFLDHWRPGAALLVESELWPNLIVAASRRPSSNGTAMSSRACPTAR